MAILFRSALNFLQPFLIHELGTFIRNYRSIPRRHFSKDRNLAFADHLQENLGALNVTLTSEDINEMDTAFSKLTVHGGRMNKIQMELCQ